MAAELHRLCLKHDVMSMLLTTIGIVFINLFSSVKLTNNDYNSSVQPTLACYGFTVYRTCITQT